MPELEAFIGNFQNSLRPDAERRQMDYKRRRAKTMRKKAYYAQIRGISAQMKPVRDKLKIAKVTLETVPKVQQLLDIERNMEEKILTQKKEEKER